MGVHSVTKCLSKTVLKNHRLARHGATLWQVGGSHAFGTLAPNTILPASLAIPQTSTTCLKAKIELSVGQHCNVWYPMRFTIMPPWHSALIRTGTFHRRVPHPPWASSQRPHPKCVPNVHCIVFGMWVHGHRGVAMPQLKSTLLILLPKLIL